MARLKKLLSRLARPKRGQTMTELGIILILLSIVAYGVLGTIGTRVQDMFGLAVAGF